jgi:ribosomal protein L20A (L18A)
MYQLPSLKDIKHCRPSVYLFQTLKEVKEFQKNCRTLKDFNASEKIIKEINSKVK